MDLCVGSLDSKINGGDICLADSAMLRPNDIYKFITLLPKDCCLIPGNGAIKLIDRTKTHIRIYDTTTK